MIITKLLIIKGGNPEKARILMLAPTDVAAVNRVNISGTTICNSLRINVGSKI